MVLRLHRAPGLSFASLCFSCTKVTERRQFAMTSTAKPSAAPFSWKENNDAAVNAALEQYENMKLAHPDQEIDEFWVWPKELRPRIGHDFFDIELPVIDLAPSVQLKKLREEAAQLDDQSARKNDIETEIKACEAATIKLRDEMRAACEEYGFFQIINHGMPLDVIKKFRQSCSWLFEFPEEVRQKVGLISKPFKPVSTGFQSIHRSNKVTNSSGSHIWNEAFEMECPELYYPGRMDDVVNTLWPEDAKDREKGLKFRSRVEQYGKGMNEMTFHVLDLLAASLGLASSEPFLGHGRESQIEARLRVNHYPICAQPELTWGVHGHMDPSVLTILHQDEVGGLQISFRDGSLHGVRPIPDGFVVNVGDYLQATTNGRFISAEHHVVANSKSERFSLGYFASCPANFVLKPVPQLVDPEHPLLYKPFTKTEYVGALLQYGLSSRNNRLLERFFRVEYTSKRESP